MNEQAWHFDPNDDDEYDPDYVDEGPDTGPESDRELDFNTRFGWSILDDIEGNDEADYD